MATFLTFRALATAGVLSLAASIAQAQSANSFRQTFTVGSSETVQLDVSLSSGDLQVIYSRDGRVVITAYGTGPNGARLDPQYLGSLIEAEQRGNRIRLRDVPQSKMPQPRRALHFRIDVPYRTSVSAQVDSGSQAFTGIIGPVDAVGGRCDIKASYVSKGVRAQVESGNLDIEVIGERVQAKTGSGNVTGTRLAQGMTAESGDGDISLTVVGPSIATIKSGAGRIDVGAARGAFEGSTFAGDLHIKAEPLGDWILHSVSGAVRMEMPPVLKGDIDVATDSGVLQIDREDIVQPPKDSRRLALKLNGGGPHIQARTFNGKILIR